MNCRPGDLAIVIRSRSGLNPQHIGRLLKVVGPSKFHLEHWETEPELRSICGNFIDWHDQSLKPIRDPGDDAVDQTLLWLPVPSREKEQA